VLKAEMRKIAAPNPQISHAWINFYIALKNWKKKKAGEFATLQKLR
jgi:hypothetical protein